LGFWSQPAAESPKSSELPTNLAGRRNPRIAAFGPGIAANSPLTVTVRLAFKLRSQHDKEREDDVSAVSEKQWKILLAA
jgi:hypothetical protein